MSETAVSKETLSKPPAPFSMVPAPDIESYDAVPWFRKAWFVFFPLFMPVAIIVALTGDVYAKARGGMKELSDAQVWRSTVANRAFIICSHLFVVVTLTVTLVL